ncbi:class I glutamine amidotransferase-like protein [Cantharellus anzutake]|uniref:class I glutamine amidotransferase-like protein n=1 Tax=Cantharellus anzutake TaxID=1750568 RepID=UPI0019075EB9|nr:class I glutamine amidotransferase-like protein [Cantharellus anzutake]KAF8331312.1 class I glutamine amidotransferase-like protein [Cantharellus anzutake]
MSKHVRIGLLICDTPLPTVVSTYGDYLSIFHTLLESSLAYIDGPCPSFALTGYDVVQGKFPTSEDLSNMDGILISGSGASAYSPLPWIDPLLDFISRVTIQHPMVKIIGICFGQQVVARALGGDCVRNERGWEIGVYEVDLTDLGRRLFQKDTLRIQEMHRDHVPSLPPNFLLLGSTPKCDVQGMLLPYESRDVNNFEDVHILCVQGHPEFVSDMVQKIIDAREKSGVLDAPTVREARHRATQEDDGVGAITRAIWKTLGITC